MAIMMNQISLSEMQCSKLHNPDPNASTVAYLGMHLQYSNEAGETSNGTRNSSKSSLLGRGTGVLSRSASGTRGVGLGLGSRAGGLLRTGRGLRGGSAGFLGSLGRAGARRDGVASNELAHLAGVGRDQARIGAVGRQRADPAGDLVAVLVAVFADCADIGAPLGAQAASEGWLVAVVGVRHDGRGDIRRGGGHGEQVVRGKAAHEARREGGGDVAEKGAEVDAAGGDQRLERAEIKARGDEICQIDRGGILALHELADLDDFDLRARGGKRRSSKERNGQKGERHSERIKRACLIW